MKNKPLRISVVSYINSMPFVYGIKNSGFLKNYSLSLDIPSVCAEKLLKGKADIGLAPVAALMSLKKYFILPGFCIGADGPVSSVMLYSDVPLKEIGQIFLDHQSRTSVLLVQLLAKNFWKIDPEFIPAPKGYEAKIKGSRAGLIIGDRNFKMKKKFSYVYDLAGEWLQYTGLPFVFACWISNKKIDKKFADDFYKALKFGVDNRNKVIAPLDRTYDKRRIRKYLNENISYYFDEEKHKAMELFLKLGKEIA
jgi:chorismate dehydratase